MEYGHSKAVKAKTRTMTMTEFEVQFCMCINVVNYWSSDCFPPIYYYSPTCTTYVNSDRVRCMNQIFKLWFPFDFSTWPVNLFIINNIRVCFLYYCKRQLRLKAIHYPQTSWILEFIQTFFSSHFLPFRLIEI